MIKIVGEGDAAKELFPLKMRDAAQAAGFAYIKSKGLIPEEDSDDYIPVSDTLWQAEGGLWGGTQDMILCRASEFATGWCERAVCVCLGGGRICCHCGCSHLCLCDDM